MTGYKTDKIISQSGRYGFPALRMERAWRRCSYCGKSATVLSVFRQLRRDYWRMPLKNGHLTGKERTFVKHMANTSDATYAATKAGYAQPSRDGWRLMENPLVAEATREAGRALLYEKAGAIGVATLVSISIDKTQPAGARVTAGTQLVKLSGMAITEAQGEKELHEMTGDELRQHTAKLEAQAAAMRQAMADRARPVLENEPDLEQNAQVAPNPFD
jgi:phage terminase small subunit